MFGKLINAAKTTFDTVKTAVEKAPKPTCSMSRFEIRNLTLRDITFLFDVAVKNPYPVDLKFSEVALDFTVEGSKVFSTKTRSGMEIAGNKSANSTFETTLTFEAVINICKDYASKENLSTVIATNVAIPIPSSIKGLPPKIDFPFTFNKEIPTIKPLVSILNFGVKMPSKKEIEEAAIKAGKATIASNITSFLGNLLSGKAPPKIDVKIDDLDFKLNVGFDIVLENKGGATLSFHDLGFKLFVNDSPLVDGNSSNIRQEGKKSTVRVDNEFSSKNMCQQILVAFQSGVGKFKVSGGTKVKLPDAVQKEPLPLDFCEEGEFKLR